MLRFLCLFVLYILIITIVIFLAWILNVQKMLFFKNIYYNISILFLVSMACLFIEHKMIWSKTIFFKTSPSILEPISMGILIYLLYYYARIVYELTKNNLYSDI